MLIAMSTLFGTTHAQNMLAGLHYIYKDPRTKTAKPPVVILLHGLRSNEKDLFSFADALPPEFIVLSLQAPLTLGADQYAWFESDLSTGKPIINAAQAEKSRLQLLDFLQALPSKFHYDHDRVFLVGFSQGAIMSLYVGLTKPELVNGIAVLSGRLLDEAKTKEINGPLLKHLRVFLAHGINDNVLPLHYADETHTYLQAKQIPTVFKTYPEGHTICRQELDDLVVWLKEKAGI